jgi:hypothetical protein
VFESTVTPAAAAPDKHFGMLKVLLDYPVSLCTSLGIGLMLMLWHQMDALWSCFEYAMSALYCISLAWYC